MSLKTFTLYVLALMAVQLVVVLVVTRSNKRYFDGRPAAEYSLAIRELSREKLRAAFAIKACYVLWVVEVLAVASAKYVFNLSV